MAQSAAKTDYMDKITLASQIADLFHQSLIQYGSNETSTRTMTAHLPKPFHLVPFDIDLPVLHRVQEVLMRPTYSRLWPLLSDLFCWFDRQLMILAENEQAALIFETMILFCQVHELKESEEVNESQVETET
jgi:hypothetical protein